MPLSQSTAAFNGEGTLVARVRHMFQICCVGQNVADAGHREFGGGITGALPGEVPRSVYGKFTWRF